MADPVTLGLTLGATALKTAGEVGASKFNEKTTEQNIGIIRDQTVAEEERVRRESRRAQGATRAARGASGVTVEGSPLEIFEENAMMAALDVLNVRYKGALQERKFENQLTLEKQKRKTAIMTGLISGGKAIAGPTGFNFGGV